MRAKRRGGGSRSSSPVPVAPSSLWRTTSQAAVIGMFVLALIAALGVARPVLLPAASAIVVTMMLGALSARAERAGIPAIATAIVLWLLVIAIFYGLIALLASPVLDWIGKGPEIGRNIYMALAYSGDQHVLNTKAGTPGVWRYTVPKEGTLSWLDCVSVAAHSPRKALALKFLDYLGSPESAAANAESLAMPTASDAALKLIPKATRDDPEIYTPADILAKSQYQEELSIQSIQTRRRIISSMANFQ